MFQHFRRPLQATAFALTAALAACNGAGQSPATPVTLSALPQPDVSRKPPRRLAVSEYENKIAIFDGSYQQIATITDGLNDPGCIFYDQHENLYAANNLGKTVTEYDRNGKLTFTYSKGLIEPGCVATDSAGNVYVTDFNSNHPSLVIEYPQKSNTPLLQCYTARGNGGIAVDAAGDVFVTGFSLKTGNANILEFKGGLRKCQATTFLVTLSFAMAIRLDRNNELVAADQECCVEIIPPPYDSITQIITGANLPVDLALTKSNGLIYIVDAGSGDILIATYSNGKILGTLGASQGLSNIQGVATYPYL